MGLLMALQAVRKVLDKDNRNKVSRTALAKHLGHDSLSGPALTKIGALRAYGLVEGSGDELRVSDDAVTALMAPEGSEERKSALVRLATHPHLFQEIRKDFPTLPSAENLKYWLIKRQFKGDAAEKAAKSYLTSMRLAAGESAGYTADSDEEEPSMPPGSPETRHILDRPAASIRPPAATSPMLQEVFNLDEGPVTLAFPSALSEESYEELKAQLELFLRRAQRRAGFRSSFDDPAYRERREAEIKRRADANEEE